MREEDAVTTLTEAEQTELDEVGFRIDGQTYPIPTLDSLDMEEGQILYDLAGLTIEDFVPVSEDADEEERERHSAELVRRVKNPAFLRALLTIAYRRGNPKLPAGRVRDVVAASNHLEAMSDFLKSSARAAREGDPRIPPALPTEPPRSSDGNSDDSSESSGIASESGSVARDESLEPTGVTRSAI